MKAWRQISDPVLAPIDWTGIPFEDDDEIDESEPVLTLDQLEIDAAYSNDMFSLENVVENLGAFQLFSPEVTWSHVSVQLSEIDQDLNQLAFLSTAPGLPHGLGDFQVCRRADRWNHAPYSSVFTPGVVVPSRHSRVRLPHVVRTNFLGTAA